MTPYEHAARASEILTEIEERTERQTGDNPAARGTIVGLPINQAMIALATAHAATAHALKSVLP